MPTFLNIETSSINCSVSIFKDDQLIGSKEAGETYQHSEKLHTFIKELSEQCSIPLKNIDTIAVGAGPGSFTGLRIGVSAAKGLCFALDKPLISCSSLRSMSAKVLSENGKNLNPDERLCPLIDARRMEVYCAIYNQELELKSKISAEIIDEETFLPELNKSVVYFFGDGMEKVKPLYEGHKNARFIKDVYPSSKYMINEAMERFESRSFEDVAYFEPFYLKDFHAVKSKK